MNSLKKSKKVQATVALILIVLLLLNGTFAFTSFNQRAFNPSWSEANYGGRIRDEYSDDQQSEDGSGGNGHGSRNKDVFAENFGDNNLFVRIRFREFLEVDGEAVYNDTISGAVTPVIDHTQTWPIYLTDVNNAHARRPETHTDAIGEEGIEWTLGHPEDGKVYMPTFNHAIYAVENANIAANVPPLFAHSQAFRMTEATGRGIDAIAFNTRYTEFNPDDMTSAENFSNMGWQTGPGMTFPPAAPEFAQAVNFDFASGIHGDWSVGEYFEAPLIYTITEGNVPQLRTTGTNVRHYAQLTEVPSFIPGSFNSGFNPADYEDGLMTMAQWVSYGHPAGNFWIADEDGWFYWNGFLYADEEVSNATSLLLDAIYIPDRRENWEYLIEVDGDFFTWESIDAAHAQSPISTHARLIFERAAGQVSGFTHGTNMQTVSVISNED